MKNSLFWWNERWTFVFRRWATCHCHSSQGARLTAQPLPSSKRCGCHGPQRVPLSYWLLVSESYLNKLKTLKTTANPTIAPTNTVIVSINNPFFKKLILCGGLSRPFFFSLWIPAFSINQSCFEAGLSQELICSSQERAGFTTPSFSIFLPKIFLPVIVPTSAGLSEWRCKDTTTFPPQTNISCCLAQKIAFSWFISIIVFAHNVFFGIFGFCPACFRGVFILSLAQDENMKMLILLGDSPKRL